MLPKLLTSVYYPAEVLDMSTMFIHRRPLPASQATLTKVRSTVLAEDLLSAHCPFFSAGQYSFLRHVASRS